MKRYEEYQREAIEKTNFWREEANKELHRRMRNKVFKDMEKEYRAGMLPHCPKCGEIFDPAEISHWTNKKYYENEGEV